MKLGNVQAAAKALIFPDLKIRYVILAFLFHGFGVQLWFTLFPKYLVDLGIPGPYIGLIFTSYQAMIGFTPLPAGRIADAVGRKAPLIVGSSLTLLTTFFLGFTQDMNFILVLMILYGLSYGLMIPAGIAYVGDVISKGRPGRAFANFYTTSQLGLVAGAFLSGFVKSRFDPVGVFVLAAGFILISVLAFAFLKEERKPSSLHGLREAFSSSFTSGYFLLRKDRGLLLLTTALVFHGFGFSMIIPFITPYAAYGAGLSEPEIGLVIALWYAALTLGMAPFGRVIDMVGGKVVLFLHILLSTGSWTIYAHSSGFPLSAVNMVVFGTVGAMDIPARRSIMVEHESKQIGKGTVIGTVDSVTGLVAIGAPTFGGYLWSALGYRSPFLIASMINTIALIPMIVLLRKHQELKDLQTLERKI